MLLSVQHLLDSSELSKEINFKMPSPLMLKIIAKTLFFLFCLYGCLDYGIPQEMLEYANGLTAGRYMHLTTLGLLLTTSTLFLGFFQQVHPEENASGLQKHIKELYMTLLLVTLPIEVLIVVAYWFLHMFYPRLLFPEIFIQKNIRTSLFTNFCLHLFPLIALLLEIYERKVRRSNLHLLVLLLFAAFYYCLCRQIAEVNETWPYPFLNSLSGKQRFATYAGFTLLAAFLYEGIVWIKNLRPVEEVQKYK